MTELELDAFLAVCQKKSLTHAAMKLFISQSALSIRLKTLEKELGCVLIHRQKGNREITLTAEGKAFYNLALEYRALTQKMKTIGKKNVKTTMRIGCINSVGSQFLPIVCEHFLQRYPDIQIDFQSIRTLDACQKIERGELKLDFSTINIQTTQILSTPLFAEEMVFICSASSDYPETVELDMLRVEDERYTRWSSDHELWHQKTFGEEAVPRICMGFVGQLQFFSQESNNWAIVPHSIVLNMNNMPNIRQCKMAFDVPDRTIYALSNRQNKNNATIYRFLDCFQDVFLELQVKGRLL